jgi:hypothetical protein
MDSESLQLAVRDTQANIEHLASLELGNIISLLLLSEGVRCEVWACELRELLYSNFEQIVERTSTYFLEGEAKVHFLNSTWTSDFGLRTDRRNRQTDNRQRTFIRNGYILCPFGGLPTIRCFFIFYFYFFLCMLKSKLLRLFSSLSVDLST